MSGRGGSPSIQQGGGTTLRATDTRPSTRPGCADDDHHRVADRRHHLRGLLGERVTADGADLLCRPCAACDYPRRVDLFPPHGIYRLTERRVEQGPHESGPPQTPPNPGPPLPHPPPNPSPPGTPPVEATSSSGDLDFESGGQAEQPAEAELSDREVQKAEHNQREVLEKSLRALGGTWDTSRGMQTLRAAGFHPSEK